MTQRLGVQNISLFVSNDPVPEIPDPCNPNPCENGGTCVVGGDNYTCICPDGFFPPDCKPGTYRQREKDSFTALRRLNFKMLISRTHEVGLVKTCYLNC